MEILNILVAIMVFIMLITIIMDTINFNRKHNMQSIEMQKTHNIRMEFLNTLDSQQKAANENARLWEEVIGKKFNYTILLIKENRIDECKKFLEENGLFK